jgi:prepilin-type N-terminal cleavage/methylation domain-containing protein
MKTKALNNSGITLMELLIVISIISILSLMAVPTYRTFTQTQNIRSAASAIKHQLIAAKIRAISDPVHHCGVVCDTNADTPKTAIFFDRNGDNKYTAGSDSLYSAPYYLPRGTKLTVSDITDSVIIFRGDGSAKNTGAASAVITVLNKAGTKTRTITVRKNTGRIFLL